MTRAQMEKSVLKMLESSGIDNHQKRMLRILMPVMAEDSLKRSYDALRTEKDEHTKLDKKAKRIELKYKVMVDGLNKAAGKKATGREAVAKESSD